MKLLLHANLSWRLTNSLKQYFTDCQHVDHIGLPVPAKDVEIWNYALAREFIIVTNDEDFLNLSMVKGFPPKVILLRTGNQNSKNVEAILVKHQSEIAQFAASAEYGILEIFDNNEQVR